ncbi:MAG: hypothetical protein C0623_13425 [Desulfuromonas sp.]|nr:MAG: hypothetical protein C0623_13425 [Desulfuromonas sp.]
MIPAVLIGWIGRIGTLPEVQGGVPSRQKMEEPRGRGRALRHTLLLSHKMSMQKTAPLQGAFLSGLNYFCSTLLPGSSPRGERGSSLWQLRLGYGLVIRAKIRRPQEQRGQVKIINGFPLRLLRRAQYKITQDRQEK